MLVSRRGHQTVGQATFGVHANVRFHAEVPLVTFLGLVHVFITAVVFVFGRAGGLNDGGIHQGALGH
ncbi:Uncharacterised protein [Enterobacter cloacae]|nr:Uncharacterised protein [Enterobacter cloacae]